ncbi:MAG: VIT1/CCC1 transporter family protein [Thermoplasmata archaeon]
MGASPHEPHPHATRLSDFILGSQDGLVNVLGIILGLSAATTNTHLILVATLAALGAESISMGAVAYTSTESRRKLYLSEIQRESREMREIPEAEKNEVREILENWGYQGPDLEDMLDRIIRNPKAMLEIMMAFELKLSPVAEQAPRESALLVGGATVFGSFVPLVPFLIVGALPGTQLIDSLLASVVLSGVTLFLIGYYEARTTTGSLVRSGLQMLVIGLAAGFAGFLIGHFLGAAGTS